MLQLELTASSVDNTFIMPAQVGDSQILREAVLGGHEVFDAASYRRDFDPPGDVGGEGVGLRCRAGLPG